MRKMKVGDKVRTPDGVSTVVDLSQLPAMIGVRLDGEAIGYYEADKVSHDNKEA